MGTFGCKGTNKWLLFSCVCVSLISVKAGVTSAVKKHFAWFYMSGDDDTLALTENVVQ